MRVVVAVRQQVLRVPVRLVHHDEVGPFVYADRNGKIELIRPKFGLTGAEHVEVTEGLEEGDKVLAAPAKGISLPVGRKWKAP